MAYLSLIYLSQCLRPFQLLLRSLQVQAESDGEKKLAEILKQSFAASQIAVKDISGQYFSLPNFFLFLPLILAC